MRRTAVAKFEDPHQAAPGARRAPAEQHERAAGRPTSDFLRAGGDVGGSATVLGGVATAWDSDVRAGCDQSSRPSAAARRETAPPSVS